jgi:hypothetical protein
MQRLQGWSDVQLGIPTVHVEVERKPVVRPALKLKQQAG